MPIHTKILNMKMQTLYCETIVAEIMQYHCAKKKHCFFSKSPNPNPALSNIKVVIFIAM